MHEELRNLLLDQGWSYREEGLLVPTQPRLWQDHGARLLVILAGWGFMPTTAGFRQLLATPADTALSLGLFATQPYLLRQPTLADLDALEAIEAATWPLALCASRAEIRQRIEQYPQGQLVAVLAGRVVGVIYSQRIADAQALLQTDFRAVAGLHRPDGPVVQLLAVNVLPEVQDYALGDQLLEFVLQCCTLRSEIARVVGVTRCKNYPQYRDRSVEEYVGLRSERGQPIDPVLNFHAAHGARIGPVIPGYRPPDLENLGTAVLVEYDDLRGRLDRRPQSGPSVPGGSSAADLPTLVDQAVCGVLGAARATRYTRHAPLRELGLDSVDLLELRMALRELLGQEFAPTLFFRYPSAQALIDYLRQALQASAATLPQTAAAATPPPIVASAVARPDQPYREGHEPIAIIGMACRFPGGVDSPATFWALLRDGVDAIGTVPPDRWDADALSGDQPGQIRTRYGGFLDQIDGFDAPFFRIAPVEAVAMDPQQRLLLETHWEALEHAGINPATLKDSATGIFVGMFGDDYKLVQARQPGLSTYFGTGTSNAVAAGRLAYVLGTSGPAMTVDTACSASLVAVHLACQSLRTGETGLALASGVNLLLSPELSIAFSQANMLAPDGRCKTFDAAANGYVRSEGCGVVVLKRWSDAQRDGDTVLALIRGTAINQDGASNGLTAPNGQAQEAVIRQALAAAGLLPHDIGYVEAHGTGTALGDPIEVQALEAVYAQGRGEDHPLLVGSVKTNIGHTEAAAGIAGLLKVVLALQHGSIPPHLHFRAINPLLADAAVTIPTALRAWPQPDPARPRRAAVSSFGFSGTNAHAVLEAAPASVQTVLPAGPAQLLTLSAQSEQALLALAQRYAAALPAFTNADLPAIAATTGCGRAHFGHRLALVAATIEEARVQLTAFAERTPGSKQSLGHVGEGVAPPKVAFLFTGQGAQYHGMGRELYATQPLFRAVIDRCDLVMHAALGRSLIALLYPAARPDHNDLLESHPCGQAVNYALECALSDLWRAWGVQPAALLGHSLGDFAAAYTAGVIALEDGLRLVIERGRLMERALGSMLAVQASEAEVMPFLEGFADVTIGVINGPNSLVVSGGREHVAQVAARLSAAGFKTRALDIPVAAHSPLLEPVLDAFTTAVRMVRLSPPLIPVVSSMTGQLVCEELTDPLYWRQHLRNTIRFGAGVLTLYEQGCRVLIEIGPRATLLGMAGLVLDEQAKRQPDIATTPTLMLPSLREEQGDTERMLLGLGMLYTQGLAINWAALHPPALRRRLALPTYPFQRQRYWVEAGVRQPETVAPSAFARWLESQTTEQLSTWVAERVALDPAEQQIAARVLATLTSERDAQQRAALIDGLLYELVWEPQARPPALAPSVEPGHWLILTDTGGVGAALAELLRAHGQQAEELDDPAGLADRIALPGAPLRGVVYLWALDAPAPTPDRYDSTALASASERLLGSVLHLVQTLALATDTPARLWIITQEAQQLADSQPVAVAQTPLWGLGRVIGLEHGQRWGGLIDLDRAATPTEQARMLLDELLALHRDGETELAYRQGRRLVARLVRGKSLQPARSVAIRPDAVYLITGGLGALGLLVAQMLADQGARRLILAGRRGAVDAQACATVAELAARGVEVQIAQVDVSDATALTRLFADIQAGDLPLKGVFHTAGVLDDGILLNQTSERFARALAAKVRGSWLLHEQTRDLDLDLLVFYSSVVALLGNAGQASYAAANAFMDGLACLRRQQGLPGLSINWGVWAEAGMAMRAGQLSLAGVQALPPDLAMQALAQLLSANGQIGVAAIDWEVVAAAGGDARPLLARLVPQRMPIAAGAATPASHTTLVETLAGLAPSRRLERLLTYLQELTSRLLGMAEPAERTTGLTNLGMDSLIALELRRQLERDLGRSLPTTVAFEHPSIEALARYLLAEVLVLAEPQPAQTTTAAPSHRHTADEPIAVVSIACRFPGANTPEAFWQLLLDGTDMVGEIPATRWNADEYYDPRRPMPGKMYVRQGAFVDAVEQFDPLFFGIAPREVASMDPQHWLLLETSWEALERAGMPQSALVESRTGVFIGIGVGQYGSLHVPQDLTALDSYAITSGGHSVAAGRLAYLLGVQGPTVAVDTACSSSLVALHLACQSLRAGECDLALAGGVSLMLSPLMHVALSQMQVLSPDGRCKAFDAAADGYGRGEGGAMVLLKRLSDAQASGDPILAVVAGSAINHDGQSSGLTVPNKRAQEKLVRAALSNANLTPDAVAYVETHGTGTPLGDPIELRALGAVFGAARPQPLLVGTVKSNIGHLEAAAGVAGFVKAVLAVQHGQIPRQLHFHTPNPYIEWDDVAVAVPTTLRPWPGEAGRRRVVGVSSFGISGTNAHMLVEAAPAALSVATAATAPTTQPAHLLLLSAKSAAALADLAARYQELLRHQPQIDLGDLCHTAAVGRNHFAQRVAIVAEHHAGLQASLQALRDGQEAPAIVRGSPGQTPPRIAFLFTGQGAQYAGMGHTLYATQPVFRATLDRCAELLLPLLGVDIRPIIFGEAVAESNQHANGAPHNLHASSLDNTAFTQPALFALEYALAALWQAWGLRPDVLIGHSLGELVAACVAGVFDLADGLRLVAARGRLMAALPHDGAMFALQTDPATALAAISPYASLVSIAAVNGPQSVVIAGKQEAVHSVAQQLAAAGVKARRLAVSHAFHSPLMDPMLDAFRRVAADIRYHPPALPLVSNLSGGLVGDALLDPDYWTRHVREPVRFADGVATLLEQGCTVFIEIGPHPTLLGMADSCPGTGSVAMLPSLWREQPDWQTLLASLGQLYVRGAAIDWTGLAGDTPRRRLALLPTYPFQRRPYWANKPVARRAPTLRPLIDRMIKLPLHDQTLFETELSLTTLPFLAEHRVYGALVSPGACQLTLALAAASLLQGRDQALALGELVFPRVLVLPEEGRRMVQLVAATPADRSMAQADLTLISFDPDAPAREPVTHATGLLLHNARPAAPVDLEQLRQRCLRPGLIQRLYERSAAAQIELGPSFRWIAELWHGPDDAPAETLARLAVPEPVGSVGDYLLHPGLLDACFQTASLARAGEASGATLLPFALEELRLYRPARSDSWWCHAVQTSENTWTICLFAAQGELLAVIERFEMRPATDAAIRRADVWRDWLYQITWQPGPAGLPPEQQPRPAMVFEALAQALPLRWEQAQAEPHQGFTAALEALSVEYVLAAFARAGFAFQPGTHWRTEQIARLVGVIPSYQRLLVRLLGILAEAGVLRQERDGWLVVQTPPATDPARSAAALQTSSATAPELLLLTRCGARLSEVLRGVQEPLELLFPGGDSSVANRLYTESPVHRVMNSLVQDALGLIVARLPEGHGLRILEIGGGTGGTTAGLLPLLPTDRTEYLFTDIGLAFVRKALERFGGDPFVSCQTLDIEHDPASQGFGRHQADLVLAANVLHATSDLAVALAHVRQLLQPGGTLLLLEVTQRSRWVDLTFGLTDGWWRFADERQEHPLLTAAQWQTLLHAHGFPEVELVERGGHALIVARASDMLDERPSSATARSWLLFADAQGLGATLAARLRQQGDWPVLVTPGPAYAETDSAQVTIRPDCPADYQRLLAAFPAHGLVHLWSLDSPAPALGSDLVALAERGSGTLLLLVQALLEARCEPVGLWCITRAAQAVAASDRVEGLAQAGVWGLGRVIDQEHPELNCVRVDIGAADPNDRLAAQLCSELQAAVGSPRRERQIALRGGTRLHARLTRLRPEQRDTPRCQPDATYLITGGLGGLGLATAAWLIEQGARWLVLVGRSQPAPETQARLAALSATGANVTVVQCDVAERAQVQQLIGGIDPTRPLRGVVHAVGVLDDGALPHQSWARFARVLGPKVQGVWNLHEATAGLPLDFFVIFSAAAGLLGNRGQANHAAANSVLDAFAAFRRAMDLPALAIDWGAWAEIGAAAELMRQSQAELVARGLGAMSPREGIGALAGLLGQTSAQVAVLPIDWPTFLAPESARQPFFAAFLDRATLSVPAMPTSAPASLRQQLEAAPAEQRPALIGAWLGQIAARTLHLPEPPHPQIGFSDMGMDSLMTIELRRRLEKELGVALPSTIAFEYPTVELLGQYLLGTALALGNPPNQAAAAPDNHADVSSGLELLSDDELGRLLAQELALLDEQ